MINQTARNERYSADQLDEMAMRHTTAADKRMLPNWIKVAEALDEQGYLAMWAHGKGEGWWIKGMGYMSLRAAARLVNVKLSYRKNIAS